MSGAGERDAADAERAAALQALRAIPDHGWRAAGVSLYLVLAPGVRVARPVPPSPGGTGGTGVGAGADGPSASPHWHSRSHIEEWTLYQVAVPAHDKDGTLVEVEYALSELPERLDAMLAEAYAREPALRTGACYTLLHVKRLLAPPPASGSGARPRGRAPSAANEAPALTRVVKVYLRAILDLFDPTRPGAPRGYYDHYDAAAKRRGYLAVGRGAAMLGNLSDAALRVLATQLQSGELEPAGGLSAATYGATLSRVAQWSANEDVRESVDMLERLRTSGDAATQGQIWLSYALAGIGIALAFLAYLREPLWLAPGLALLGGSCVFHATYAQRGTHVWRRIGLALFWLGVALVLAGLALGASAVVPLPRLPGTPA